MQKLVYGMRKRNWKPWLLLSHLLISFAKYEPIITFTAFTGIIVTQNRLTHNFLGCTVDDFGQFFVLLELKDPRRQFHPRFHFFLAVLMLLYHTSLITFLRSSPNRFYPALKFEIYQKLAKMAKITIFRAPLSLFRDELGLS